MNNIQRVDKSFQRAVNFCAPRVKADTVTCLHRQGIRDLYTVIFSLPLFQIYHRKNSETQISPVKNSMLTELKSFVKRI